MSTQDETDHIEGGSGYHRSPKSPMKNAHYDDDAAKASKASQEASGNDAEENKKRMADGKALREVKRRKFLAKQKAKQAPNRTQGERDAWLQNHHKFATHLTMEKLENSNVEPKLEALLRPYRNLQQQQSDQADYFIAEGTETVRLLLQTQSSKRKDSGGLPPIQLYSVFVKTTTFFENPVKLVTDVEEAAKTFPKETPPTFQVLVGSEDVQSKVVGFSFCRGALACGKIPSYDEDWLMTYLKNHPRFHDKDDKQHSSLRLVALDGVCDTANLGSTVRSASAFGLDAVLLSNDCCSAWYRKAVRVSMGHICRIPCVRVKSLAATLQRLQEDLGVVSYAAVIDKDADICVLEKMKRGDVSGAWCCVVGNEGNGISKQVVEACSKRLRIDMEEGVDSLSVPVATGILLHGLKEREDNKYSNVL